MCTNVGNHATQRYKINSPHYKLIYNSTGLWIKHAYTGPVLATITFPQAVPCQDISPEALSQVREKIPEVLL